MIATPNRRWFRFSLRTLFVVVTVIACWLGWNLHHVRERQRLVDFISSDVGMYPIDERPNMVLPSLCVYPKRPTGTVPLSWRLLGAKPITELALRRAVVLTPDDLRRAQALLPELNVTIVPFMPERRHLLPPFDEKITRVVNPFVD